MKKIIEDYLETIAFCVFIMFFITALYNSN